MMEMGAFTIGTAKMSGFDGATINSQGKLENARVKYDLITTPGTMATLANTLGLPATGSELSEGAGVYVMRYDFQCLNEHAGVWRIIVEYGHDQPESEDEQQRTSKITAIWGGDAESTVDIVYDAETGEPVLNAAGDPFDSVPQRQSFAPMIKFTRLQSYTPVPAQTSLSGTVNSGAVTVFGYTFAARTARIKIEWRDLLTDEKLNYEVNITIEGRRNIVKDAGGAKFDAGWDEYLIEQGYYYLDQGGQRMRFMEAEEDGTGDKVRPSAAPCLIDGAGGDWRGHAPTLKQIRSYVGDTWAALNLPS